MQYETETVRNEKEENCYRIKIKGVLNASWSARFGGLKISSVNGATMLTGPVIDQAALHGLLNQIRDLGLPLLLVEFIGQRSTQKEDVPNNSNRANTI